VETLLIMVKKKIPQPAEEINTEEATIERQEVPYFQAANSIIDDEDNLTAYEMLVYFVLCRYANNGKAAFPSYATIAKKAAISPRSVARALTGLLEKGFIKKQNRTGSSNLYSVIWEPMPQGHRGMPQGHRGGMPQGHTIKKDLIINKKEKERGAHPQNLFSDLQDEEPKAETLQADQPGAEDTLKAGLAYYRNQYELRTDRQPVITGADVKNLKSVIKGLSAEDLTACMALMFAEDWYKNKGWPLKTFASQINQFIAKLATDKRYPEHNQINDYSPNVRKALQLVEKYNTENNAVHIYDESEIIKRGQALSAEERRQAEIQRLNDEAETMTPEQEKANRIEYLKTIIAIREEHGCGNDPEALIRLEEKRKELAELKGEAVAV
jgi:hypothetical protein